jgi:hypothetical protein
MIVVIVTKVLLGIALLTLVCIVLALWGDGEWSDGDFINDN